MRWEGRRESENVEDRRSASAPQMLATGGLGGLVLLLIALLFGADPRRLLQQQAGGGGGGGGANAAAVDPNDPRAKFVKVVLADTEDVWETVFPKAFGKNYEDPTLVMFTDRINSGCGPASAGMGPFYCPEDEKVYIDLHFYDELRDKFKADGEFAQAYVVAHEVGHHVQKLLGITDTVHGMRSRVSEAQYNQLSVRLELQADYLAGCWAHYGQKQKKFLEPGDVESALNCAKAIGDDAIQKKMQGYVVPDTFTHGTSEQRKRWFNRGLETGDLSKEAVNYFFESQRL
jgi:predicted metalloprotease